MKAQATGDGPDHIMDTRLAPVYYLYLVLVFQCLQSMGWPRHEAIHVALVYYLTVQTATISKIVHVWGCWDNTYY